MTFWPPHLYRQVGIGRGVPDAVIEAAIHQAHLIQAHHELPAILSLKHLSELSGANYDILRKVVQRQHQNSYRFFKMRKRSGGHRQICVPCKALLLAQKWIARYVLLRIPPHPSSMAYSRGQSALNCAALHCGCRWLIKVDVRQFFESISERQVFYAFKNHGYCNLVSFELARICTRVAHNAPQKYALRRWQSGVDDNGYAIHDYNHRHIGHLPQGAPTSPGLSNICSTQLDRNLLVIANQAGVQYSRYADDIIFSSSDASFDRKQAMSIVKKTFDEMRQHGLRPNTSKTSISPPGARKVVLGLHVDRDRPRLRRSYRLRLEQHLYFLRKLGPNAHAQRRGFSSVFSLRHHVFGLLNYAEYVDPEYAAPLIAAFREIEWPFGG